MPYLDLSLTIEPDLPTWPGDPALRLERVMDIHTGDAATLTKIEACVHLGTHLDAPVHFVPGGSGIDALDLDRLIGPCYVAHALDASVIDATVLEQLPIPIGTRRLLVRTRNSDYWARGERTFQTGFVGVDRSGAEWLVAHDIQLIGIDYLSIGPFDDGIVTHQVLLQAGVVIVEGLDLQHVAAGVYELLCLPLKLRAADGAPARVVLRL